MENQSASVWVAFLPLILMSVLMTVPAYLLAKEKGRNTVLWTVLALVPFINFACFWYFIGASNLKLERKIDELLLEVKRSNHTAL